MYVNNINNQNKQNQPIVQRGQIWFADLGEPKGSIQGRVRPVLIYANYKCCLYSPVVTIIPLTSEIHSKAKLPTHVLLDERDGVKEKSIALVEQVMPLNKSDLKFLVSQCTEETMAQIDKAYQIQGGIQVIDIDKILDLTETINDEIDYLEENYRDKEIYNECSMLVTELKSYCFKNNIDFEKKFNRLMGRFRNLGVKEGVRIVI